MESVNLADAKAHLSELVERALTDTMPRHPKAARSLIRRMRDEDRY